MHKSSMERHSLWEFLLGYVASVEYKQRFCDQEHLLKGFQMIQSMIMMARSSRVEIKIGVANRVLQLERVIAQVATVPFLYKMALRRPS